MNIIEKIGYGLLVMVIGLLIVFVALIILIAFISAMSALFRKIFDRKHETAVAASAPEPVEVADIAPAAPEEEEVVEAEAEVPQEVFAAAIAAAIAAYDTPEKPLVVRSVRQVAGWKRAARQEQVYRF